MKLTPQASAILRIISEHVKNNKVSVRNLGSFLGYKDVHDKLNWKMAGKTWGTSLDTQGLGDLARWALASDLPAVTGLVIDKESKSPGGKFFKITGKNEFSDQGWWLEQAGKAIEHNWDQYLDEDSEGIYRPWSGTDYEDEIPTENRLLECLKENRPIRLNSRYKKSKEVFAEYLAVVSPVEEKVFVIDYGDDRVWKENKAKDCIRGAFLIDCKSSPLKTEWYPFDVGADEIADAELYEGAGYKAFVNKWERNSQTRMLCIRKHGWTCQVCELDFEKHYGEAGKNFIHVHHLKKLADIGREHKVDPEKDLIPVCPNCHAMIHRHEDVGMKTVEQLRKILKKKQVA